MGRVRNFRAPARGEEAAFHPFSSALLSRGGGRAQRVRIELRQRARARHDEGLVLLDVGSFLFARPTKELVRSFTQKPLHTRCTPRHVDHVFGVALYEEEGAPSRVVAHRALPGSLRSVQAQRRA